MHQVQRTQIAGRDPRAHLARHRVEPVHERHCTDGAGDAPCVDQRVGRRAVERQRLLADHVLAVRERGGGERRVQLVGHAQVHDVDLGIGDQRVGRCEGPVGTEAGSGLLAPIGGRGGDADEAGTGEARCTRVGGPDEPHPDDPHTEFRWHTGRTLRNAFFIVKAYFCT